MWVFALWKVALVSYFSVGVVRHVLSRRKPRALVHAAWFDVDLPPAMYDRTESVTWLNRILTTLFSKWADQLSQRLVDKFGASSDKHTVTLKALNLGLDAPMLKNLRAIPETKEELVLDFDLLWVARDLNCELGIRLPGLNLPIAFKKLAVLVRARVTVQFLGDQFKVRRAAVRLHEEPAIEFDLNISGFDVGLLTEVVSKKVAKTIYESLPSLSMSDTPQTTLELDSATDGKWRNYVKAFTETTMDLRPQAIGVLLLSECQVIVDAFFPEPKNVTLYVVVSLGSNASMSEPSTGSSHMPFEFAGVFRCYVYNKQADAVRVEVLQDIGDDRDGKRRRERKYAAWFPAEEIIHKQWATHTAELYAHVAGDPKQSGFGTVTARFSFASIRPEEGEVETEQTPVHTEAQVDPADLHGVIGTWEVTLTKGRGWPKTRELGPMASLRCKIIGTKGSVSTHAVSPGAEPTFNDCLQLDALVGDDRTLEIRGEIVKRNKDVTTVGSARIELAEVGDIVPREIWIRLQDPEHKRETWIGGWICFRSRVHRYTSASFNPTVGRLAIASTGGTG